MSHLGAETLARALAVFISFWAQHGPLEGRDTCESQSGFYFVLGTTWASWSRDTCECLSGFYLVLGTTWVFPGGRKQIAYVLWRVWTALLTGKVHLRFDGRVRFQ